MQAYMKRLNYLLGEIDAAYHEMSLKLGMSDSAMKILYAICDEGDRCPLHEICRRTGVSKQTINSALRRLEADGIVYLDPTGARNKMVCLTEKGMNLARHTAIPMLEAENEVFAAWPREDVEQYLELTERFLVAFREKTNHMPLREIL